MDELVKYFPSLTERQIQQFESLKELYADWNDKINVISRKDLDEFYVRHVLHSMSIYKFIQFKAGTRVLDIGTGGGFPGIPLAILNPDSEFLLVDSIGKKIRVVLAVAESLGLDNVQAKHIRAEELKEKFDFIVSRAVTQLDRFLPWVKGKILPSSFNEFENGYLFLKGGDLQEELKTTKFKYQEISISSYFDEDFFETKKIIYMLPGKR